MQHRLEAEIAERQRSEQMLRETQERFELAVRGTSDGLWDWNVLTGEVWYGPRFKELLGYDPDEFPHLFATFEAHLHPDDHAHTLEAVRRHIEDDEPYDVEYRLRTKAGGYRWFRARGVSVRDETGRAVRMAGSIQDITRRKLAEAALEQERNLLHALLESLPDAIYFKDAAGRFLRVSQSLAEKLGVNAPAEVIGQTDRAFFSEDYARQAQADEQEMMSTGRLLVGKEEHPLWPDGTSSWVSTTKAPLRDREGRVIGTFGISRDITELKEAQERLRHQALEARLLHEATALAAETDNVEEALAQCVKVVCELTGWPVGHVYVPAEDGRDVLVPTRIWHLSPDGRYDALREVTERTTFERGLGLPGRIWQTGAPAWIVNVQADDNFPRAGLCDDVGVKGAFGFPVHVGERIAAVLEFFTERVAEPDENLLAVAGILGEQVGRVLERTQAQAELRQAEAALRESEKRTRLIVETALDAFVAMDERGRIIDWNTQAERIFGWTREEALGRTVAETIIPARYREPHGQGLRRYLETGEGPVLNRRIEISAIHRDGHEFPVELAISLIHLNERRIFGAFIHDITRRQQQQEELLQAKEAAESASRAKSDFLANMSHEIRTPLNAVIGMTELVLDTQMNAAQREYLTMVRDSGESLLGIINDILDFSKIEAGKLELEERPFDLRENLGDTMKSFALRAHHKGLELACHVASDVPELVLGDPNRLRQVVVNLVGNAVKFTDQGEIVVRVDLAGRSDGEVELHLAVRDTGIGIPAEKHQAIFEMFEQVDSSTTRRFGGTGLGLAISSRLVRAMQGRIWLESEVNRGSTFHFTARLGLGATPRRRREMASLRDVPVLVVDDNATNRRILEEMLSNWEMRPVAVASAREALERMREAHRAGSTFPLVLSDVHMPGVDGFEFVEQIRRDPELSSAVIMMLTSGDRPGDIARCELLEIAAYLMKPLKQSELFDAIALALGLTGPDERDAARFAAGRTRPLRPLRILLAEDSLVNQKLAVGLLERWDHSVRVCNNGKEALAALEIDSFDLVLMDVQMPELDGLEATRMIRSRERQSGRHVPIVAMTAHAMRGDREACLEAGMDGYVSKPVRMHELYDVLDSIFGDGDGDGAGAAAAPAGRAAGDGGGCSVDWSAALENALGDHDLLDELLDAFRGEAVERLTEIERAVSAGDALALEHSAHGLKGAMRSLGARCGSELAERLERLGHEGDLAAAAETYSALKRETDAVLREVEGRRSCV
ncbi:MAG TPA: PAS domain S-box protein [Planctomycetaceae bacterium]|nr:PAS domain S-box protein [Planctomycetaceae bacterium]